MKFVAIFSINNDSIFENSRVPIPIDGNTYGAAMMIGEKGADIIKQDHLEGFGH